MLVDGPVPKHVQLRQALLAAIEDELSPGAMIPSERELMVHHGVSRATVRAAISGLVSDGRLAKIPGKGTVVTRPRVESQLHLASFTQDMRRRGHRPTTRLISCATEPADEIVAKGLDLAPAASVWRIERLRLADDEPMAAETSWYPESHFPDLGAENLESSLYAILESSYGVVITGAEQTVWTERADRAHARLLDTPAGAPLFVFDRVASSSERPVERTVSRYRGDRYQLSMSLRRGPSMH
ncbi:GntR family transcriptional regulator [Aeromicrobium sp.]|uniref:GntR family transcriptional regulator n=1 Tax=Aeromicrobium sp. TaxID=1871063 RepID=UPI003D6B2607